MRVSPAARGVLAAVISGLVSSAHATRSLKHYERSSSFSFTGQPSERGRPSVGSAARQATLLAAPSVQSTKHREDPREKGDHTAAEDAAPPMAHHGHGKRSRSGVGRTLLLCFVCLVLAHLTYRMCALYVQYRRSISGFKTKGFWHYAMYSFEQWFVNTSGANAYIVLVATTVTLFLGTLLYALILRTNVPIALWRVFTWILDPGAAVAVPETQIEGILLGGSIGIIGVVIFGVLLTVMQDTFARYVDMLAEGRSPVMECNHVMLIGFTEETIPLIGQLCQACEKDGGTAIVVFSDRYTKLEMEERIRDADLDLRGSRVVVCCGKPYLEQDLRHVAAHTAKIIILMPDHEDSKDTRDALQLRTLTTLRGRGWPMNGRILVVCSVFRNFKLLEDVGGSVTDVVLLSAFVAKLIVQYSRQAGLQSIFRSMLGFDENNMIVQEVPKQLEGRPFSEAALYYPRAVPLAIISETRDLQRPRSLSMQLHRASSIRSLGEMQCTFCPSADTKLTDGCNLVLLAKDRSAATASEVAAQAEPLKDKVRASLHQDRVWSHSKANSERAPETMLMLGWNEMSGAVILEIDASSPPNSKLIIMAPKPKEERELLVERTKKRWDKSIANIEVSHREGDIGSRFHLEELDTLLQTPMETFTRIFILADEGAKSVQQADACSMFAAMQIREVIKDRVGKADTSMVIEIKYPLSLGRCNDLMLPRAVDSAGLTSKILAMLAFDSQIAMVLEQMISDEGSAKVSVRRLSRYVESLPQGSYSFFQVSAIVAALGDIAIGWSKPGGGANGEGLEGEALAFHNAMSDQLAMIQRDPIRKWEVNPSDKSASRPWDFENDCVVVVSKQDDLLGPTPRPTPHS